MLPLWRAWPRRHPFLVDTLCAFALLAVSLPVRFRLEGPSRQATIEILLAVAMTLPLALRRRHPSAVFAFIAAMALLQWSADVSIRPEDLAILIASYTVAAYGKRWEAIAATGVVLTGVVMAVGRWNFEDAIPAFVTLTAVALAALVLGDDMRHRRAYLAGLEERATRLEGERDAETRAAVAAERADIARELHDVVAHNLSVMVIQAEGATYAIDSDPVQARRAMTAVTETGRQALKEMRDLLGVLRPADDARLVPQPSLDQLGDLIAGVRQAGLPVDLRIVGERRSVPAGIELAVYRIIQEALTNTLKHAGRDARSTVEVAYAPFVLTAHVIDSGTTATATAPAPSTDAGPASAGQGLVGMRERAALYHGELRAGRRAGGFEVIATFPTRAPT